MSVKRLDQQIERSHTVVDVRVVPAAAGGWDVIATLGDSILAIQHCDDWHRAERASLRMSRNVRPGVTRRPDVGSYRHAAFGAEPAFFIPERTS